MSMKRIEVKITPRGDKTPKNFYSGDSSTWPDGYYKGEGPSAIYSLIKIGSLMMSLNYPGDTWTIRNNSRGTFTSNYERVYNIKLDVSFQFEF